MNETRKFESGHELRPNGLGDFDLYCTDGQRIGFVPYMIATTVRPGSVCNGCGQPVGEMVTATAD